MKRIFLLCLLSISYLANAQQYSLYNTRTLYDAFENPAQKAFKADTSRKYAFNFFIPNFGFNFLTKGDAQPTFKALIAQEGYTARQLPLGENRSSSILINSNIYLLMFKIFRSVNYDREMGFAWQIRSTNRALVTNETFAILDNFRLFENGSFKDPFNDKIASQTYHQFSFNYREDYNKRLGLGVKLSYISGIVSNKLDIRSSSVHIDKAALSYGISLDGTFRSNLDYNKKQKSNIVLPGIKNPGFAITTSATYKAKGGWKLMGNLKDIGFIRWGKKSWLYEIDGDITETNQAGPGVGAQFREDLKDLAISTPINESYTTLLDGTAELLINKDLGRYQPSLLISKNVFREGADWALLNNYAFGKFEAGLSGVYTAAKRLQVGAMGMYRTPAFEFYMGSDNMLKTYRTGKSAITQTSESGNSYSAGSFYMGLAVKFGPDMEHQANANSIPGFNNYDDDGPGFFRRIFSKKSSKPGKGGAGTSARPGQG